MSTRAKHAAVAGALVLAVTLVAGWTVIPADDRAVWFTVWTPVAVIVTVLADLFVWQRRR